MPLLLIDAVQKAVKNLLEKDRRVIYVNVDHEKRYIPLRNVFYLERVQRKTKICYETNMGKKAEIETSFSVQQILSPFQKNPFVRCHKSIFVNMQKIEDNAMFERAVKSIEPFGGGDDPEDGLEALAYAIRSKWNRDGSTKKRQIIVVWTDAPTHGLGYGAAAPNYPNGMPRSFEELSNWWAQEPEAQGAHMDYQAERLVLFAPDEPYWKTISDNWENVVHFPSIAGGGCGELDYNEIMETIVNSVVSNAGNQY